MDLLIIATTATFVVALLSTKLQCLLHEIPDMFVSSTASVRALATVTTVLILLRILGLLVSQICVKDAKQKAKFYFYPRVARFKDDDSSCAICLCNGSNNAVLQCGHSFHWACVRPWLDVKNACPLCKCTQSRWGVNEKAVVVEVIN